jgi:Mg2+ and Co2+ transporter CorA
MAERISDFEDLSNRTDRLVVQNVQLVEIHQDDNNKTLIIFTLITIIFLPLL